MEVRHVEPFFGDELEERPKLIRCEQDGLATKLRWQSTGFLSIVLGTSSIFTVIGIIGVVFIFVFALITTFIGCPLFNGLVEFVVTVECDVTESGRGGEKWRELIPHGHVGDHR